MLINLYECVFDKEEKVTIKHFMKGFLKIASYKTGYKGKHKT